LDTFAQSALMRMIIRKLLAGLAAIYFWGMPLGVQAQAVPDTSLNRVVPDRIPPRNAPVLESPGPDQAAYDSLRGKVLPFQPNPKKSALYSAILPGAGQLYNRQYWKIPVVYAGVGAAAGFIIYNSNKYREYRHAYISRINNPTYTDEFTTIYSNLSPAQLQQQLQLLQNAYKKDLDLTVLLSTIGYTLQVLDALAFAHLRNFDVSRDISMNVQPVAMPRGGPGLGLVMRF
jgi:hypothetical protein